MFKTGELSKIFEIDRTSLNYYIRNGLLDPKVLDNQYHSYSFEDAMALSHIRYYRGLGFDVKTIKKLLHESDHKEKLEYCKNLMNDLDNEIRIAQMKKKILKHLMDSIEFHQIYRNQFLHSMTEGYYFIPKNEITDPILKELYKMIPVSEFEVHFSETKDLLADLSLNSGLSLKEEWVKEFALSIPDSSVYYPPKEKIICSILVKGKNATEELDYEIKKIYDEFNHKGVKLKDSFTVYFFISNYSTDEVNYDLFIQIEPETLD